MADGVKAPYVGKGGGKSLLDALRNVSTPTQGALEAAVASWRRDNPDLVMAYEQSLPRINRPDDGLGLDIKTCYIDPVTALDLQSAKDKFAAQYTPAPKPKEKVLADFSNAALVMEMLSRGYAVMKLPADGGPPEVLR